MTSCRPPLSLTKRRSAIADPETDPYGTAAIRRRVLAAWADSPARFREDANTEEDYALGGYRDRVVIELAQNAGDAALRAGVPGRLRLVLAGGVLTAANTGAPLDAAGVEALSTLRASAKRDEEGTAGRFGVGFTAVVSITDTPSIVSAREAAGVAWSAARTRELVAGEAGLAAEAARRGDHVPILRLPFPVRADHPLFAEGAEGFATVVRLPLRDAEAEELVRRQLGEVGPALMLALPTLAAVEIEVDGQVRTLTAEHKLDETGSGAVTINGVAWQTVEDRGPLAPGLLADRPAEERARPFWRLRWAVPAEPPGPALGERVEPPGLAGDARGESARLARDAGGVSAVLHAPTPSDERLDLPALLIATFPLAPDRRHVAPGPLTEFLIERAAGCYIRLLRELPATPRLLTFAPLELAAGELDAKLRRAIIARLPDAPLFPTGAGRRGRGRDMVAVEGAPAFLDLLAEVLPGLLPADWLSSDGKATHGALSTLGVRRLPVADVIDLLGTLDRRPGWWRRLYAALAEERGAADALGALPVPLADGRTVRGPRGLLIATEGIDPVGLDALRLRFVHPEAVHPLLTRLGAVEAGPRAVLADPAVRAAVAGSYEADDPGHVADAVLGLVAAGTLDPGDEPWLAELALPGADGDLYPAGELLLPGSPLRDIMAGDAPFGVVADEVVERWGAEPLEAAGVLRGFALVRAQDVELATLEGGAFDLDGEELWARDVLDRLGPMELPPMLPELTAVRDLELVENWEPALRLLAEPPLFAAVADPAHVLLHDGYRVAVPSYTAWWLRGRPVLGGRRPSDLRFAEAVELAGLYDVAPGDLDAELLRALGVRRSLEELLAEPGGADELLERLGDPDRQVSRSSLPALLTALAGPPHVLGAESSVPMGITVAEPPERVRALVDGVPEVVPASDAMVLDSPDLLPLLTGQPLVIAAYEGAIALAELLDIALASEEVTGTVESAGVRTEVPPVVREVLTEAPETYLAHDPLIVDGRPVPWRYEKETGAVHAGDVGGLARGLAWAARRWSDRLLVEALLRGPDDRAALLAERDLDL